MTKINGKDVLKYLREKCDGFTGIEITMGLTKVT